MKPDSHIEGILREATQGRPITKAEAQGMLSLPEDSLEAALVRSTANTVSRRRFANQALLLGQIGVDMGPCEGGCSFCAFARPHTKVEPSLLPTEEIIARCRAFAQGGARGVFLMTMHRFGFEWFLDLCSTLRKSIPAHFEILANVGDLNLEQLAALRAVGVTGAYHVCRLGEGTDTRMDPAQRRNTIERIIEAGLAWYNSCEPIGPEHTPRELAEQIWLGVDIPCRQHAAMRRFPVPGSPLFSRGQISLARLAQIVAVIALATAGQKVMTSIAVHESNVIGLLSGANALYPEAGEPPAPGSPAAASSQQLQEGFTTALWRQSAEITTADCRRMLREAGFTPLNTARPAGHPLGPAIGNFSAETTEGHAPQCCSGNSLDG